ncbi:hypothetical protein V6N11_019353 [Hibiscus sabdariffa]|uniref:F-box domain-containing protein n=1 Tax=Hibiscus sabdariffa TaxID=183260 RepID=A0ABR2R2K9_9ROSI
MCDYIPKDVVIGILKRLPVKSLVRFRAICKSWNSVICDPCFISTHLQASLSNNTPFLLLRVTANPPIYAFDSKDMTFVNGAVHWLGFKGRNNFGCNCAILGFDMSAEEFFEMNLPESLFGFHHFDLSIMKYGESSITSTTHPLRGELHELWVMKEYGVVAS